MTMIENAFKMPGMFAAFERSIEPLQKMTQQFEALENKSVIVFQRMAKYQNLNIGGDKMFAAGVAIAKIFDTGTPKAEKFLEKIKPVQNAMQTMVSGGSDLLSAGLIIAKSFDASIPGADQFLNRLKNAKSSVEGMLSSGTKMLNNGLKIAKSFDVSIPSTEKFLDQLKNAKKAVKDVDIKNLSLLLGDDITPTKSKKKRKSRSASDLDMGVATQQVSLVFSKISTFPSNMIAQVTKFQSTIIRLQTGPLKSIGPALAPISQELDLIVPKLQDFVAKNPMINKITQGFAQASVVVGTLSQPLSVISDMFKTLGPIFKQLGPLFKLISGGLQKTALGFIQLQIAGGPVLWIIEAIIAVVILLWVAWKNNWGNIQGFVHKVWENIKKIFTNVMEWFKKWWWVFLGPIGLLIKGIQELLKWWSKLPQGSNNKFEQSKKTSMDVNHNMQPQKKLLKTPTSKIVSNTNIAKGAIVVNAAPNQSSKDIAQDVMKQLAQKGRQQSYSRPNQPVTVF